MYCTLDDLKKQLPEAILVQLTDDDEQGVVDEARVEEAIASASAVIDGYAAARYQLPFAVVPAILKPIAVDLAVYDLYARRVETMPDVREKNRNNAIKLLADISKGAVRLGAQEATSPVQTGQSPAIVSNERQFSRKRMQGL